MRADDTTLGGDGRSFPTTQWNQVRDPGQLLSLPAGLEGAQVLRFTTASAAEGPGLRVDLKLL